MIGKIKTVFVFTMIAPYFPSVPTTNIPSWLCWLTQQPIGWYSFPGISNAFWTTVPNNVQIILENRENFFVKKPVSPKLSPFLGDGTGASDYNGYKNEWEHLRTVRKEVFLPFFRCIKNSTMEVTFQDLDNFGVEKSLDAYAWCHDFFFALSWHHLASQHPTPWHFERNRILRETSPALAESIQHQALYWDRSLDSSDQTQTLHSPALLQRRAALSSLLDELQPVFWDAWAEALRRVSNPLRVDSSVSLRFALTGFFLASYENAAATTAWTLWLLAQNPEIQSHVAASLSRGDTSALEGSINESLRLYPPIWSLTRQATHSFHLGTHRVEKDQWLFVSPWVQGRLHENWSSPEKFEPQRWNEKANNNEFFLPFGRGARRCPGEATARDQITQILSLLLQKWRFDSISPSTSIIPLFGVTLRPCAPLLLNVSRR